MASHRYILCRTCGAIHHVSSFDREPTYACGSGEVQEVPANDWRAFMDRHAGHRLDALVATGEDYSPCGHAWDPMGVRYIEVSDGQETLLLRRSRSSIEEPFCYQIIDGRLAQTGLNLEIQADAIRKEMKLHFCWAPAAPMADEQIARFIAIFRQVVNEIDPHNTQAIEYPDSDENVTYCELDSALADKLLAKCGTCFPQEALASLRRFVAAHGDVLALVKRRTVAVEQQAE